MMRVLAGLNRQDWAGEAAQVGYPVEQLAPWLGRGNLVAFAGRLPLGGESATGLANWLAQHGGRLFAARGEKEASAGPVLAFVPQAMLEGGESLPESGSTGPTGVPAELGVFREVWAKHQTQQWRFHFRGRELLLDRPLVMGILNVTPDSFSDGGRYLDPHQALARAREMIDQGATIIDVGGESTRPGAEPVDADEEWRRIGPVVQALVAEERCLISVDTYKSEVARRALEAGAHLINDISGLTFDPKMAAVVAHHRVPLVLMHIQGTPRHMQRRPHYRNLMAEVFDFLAAAVRRAKESGIEQLIVDPGIGFGKRWEDNFELIRRIGEFRSLGVPILLGTSRKSFLGKLLDVPPPDRLYGNLATTVYAALQGVTIFRVHDVRPTVEALKTLQAVQNKKAFADLEQVPEAGRGRG